MLEVNEIVAVVRIMSPNENDFDAGVLSAGFIGPLPNVGVRDGCGACPKIFCPNNDGFSDFANEKLFFTSSAGVVTTVFGSSLAIENVDDLLPPPKMLLLPKMDGVSLVLFGVNDNCVNSP